MTSELQWISLLCILKVLSLIVLLAKYDASGDHNTGTALPAECFIKLLSSTTIRRNMQKYQVAVEVLLQTAVSTALSEVCSVHRICSKTLCHAM